MNEIVKPVRTCAHNDPKNFLDVHCDRPGWILTICRQCRGFIGYREAKKSEGKR